MRYFDLINKYTACAKNNNLEEEAIIYYICEVTNFSKAELSLNYAKEINPSLEEKLIKGLDKYISGYPIQYILGYTYFYGLKLKVNEDVLIPRFDTEVVVEEAINVIKNYTNPKVLDICTGSGAIAIAIAKEGYNVDACDISIKALDVARINAKDNNVEINFIESDLLRNVKEKYDILVSNPPYIAYDDEEVAKIVLDNEPHIALFGGKDGLDFYRRILNDSLNYLNEGGSIIFEIPYDKANIIKNIALKYFKNVIIKKDYNGNDRVMIIN